MKDIFHFLEKRKIKFTVDKNPTPEKIQQIKRRIELNKMRLNPETISLPVQLPVKVFKSDHLWYAIYPPLDLCGFGKTKEQAIALFEENFNLLKL